MNDLERRVSITDLERLQPFDRVLDSAIFDGKDTATGMEYTFVFVKKHPKGPYIRIDTQTRAEYKQKGLSEEQTQTRLEELATKIREFTGGLYWIHPFYGAVFHTAKSPISPGFCISDFDGLSMLLFLTDKQYNNFDVQTMFEAVARGDRAEGDGVLPFLQNQQVADRTNPNGSDRNTAVVNNLEGLWDEENRRRNSGPRPKAMEITHRNLALFVAKLKKLGIANLALERTNYSE